MNITDLFKAYFIAIQKLNKLEHCKFKIEVYERKEDYLAIFKSSEKRIKPMVIGESINYCIDKLKEKYPELKFEQGVKYFPLNRDYQEKKI